MNKVKEWTLRISQANQEELLVITYELLMDSIEELKEYILQKDKVEFKKKLRHTQKILNYLMDTLNMSCEIAYDLLSLYLYVQKLLVKCSVNMRIEEIEQAQKVLSIIQEGFIKASEVESDKDTQAVMKNSQKVYAGLTYGKGELQEVVIDQGNRGFEA